jgi:hypothetical protein
MPWLLKPYRHALKLGQLRAQVFAGHNHSFPYLAQTLSEWNCKKSHDRLIALFGLVFQEKQAWFMPSYKKSSPELFAEFAQEHVLLYKGLDILHFAGCGDSSAHSLYQVEGQIILQANPPGDDIPSWVPDWRVQSRPLTLLPNPENSSIGFSATVSAPEFRLDHHRLYVRAQEVDRIKICGLPYYELLGRRLKMKEHEIFDGWSNLAKSFLEDTCVEKMFASTLIMDGRVAVTERQEIGVNSPEVPCLFRDWAAKNLNKTNGLCEADWKDGIEESTRYGYIAEEICRNRTFFITEAGRLGLGSLHVSPGASIYLIHGLKVPFVIHHSLSMQVFRGECYTYGLMDGETQCSDQDSLLCLE